MTQIRSRADRVGQLIFTAVVIVGLAAIVWWLGSVTWPHWYFWPAIIPGTLALILLALSGVIAALRRERRS